MIKFLSMLAVAGVNINDLGDMEPVPQADIEAGMRWYKSLDMHRKMAIKEEVFELVCGMRYEALSGIFSMKQRIGILYGKLKMEGFDI